MRHDGGLLIALGAGLGLLVSICNYFAPAALLAPTADISGTPAALLAIAATAILFLAGLVLAGRRAARPDDLPRARLARRHPRHRLAAWLLESTLLLALMLRLPASAGCSAPSPTSSPSGPA